jgi:cytidylate kinase
VGFVIAIDGPSGAGKSSTARSVAERLGILFLDTGALYRALALRVLRMGVAPEDEAAVEACSREARIDLAGVPGSPHVLLDGVDVSREIRTPEVSELSSRLATQSAVRRRLVEIQREFARHGAVVAEGRDLGTVVFPDAQVKIYLDADLPARAERRTRELQARGIALSKADVQEDLSRRDERDRGRADSPLKRAADAHVLDTTPLGPEAQLEAVLRIVRSHPECPPAWRETSHDPAS